MSVISQREQIASVRSTRVAEALRRAEPKAMTADGLVDALASDPMFSSGQTHRRMQVESSLRSLASHGQAHRAPGTVGGWRSGGGPELGRREPEPLALALERVERAAPADWKAAARDAIRRVARRGELFTSDDVWEALEAAGMPPPAEPRALGALMLGASRAGLIAPAGYTPSRRPGTHAHPVRLWFLRGRETAAWP